MDEKKITKEKEKEEKKYYYHDRIHNNYIEVEGDLRSELKKMDGKTKYQNLEQYCRNNVYIIGELNYWDEKHCAYSDKGYDTVLHKMCAAKMWDDFAAILTQDEFVLLFESYVLDKQLPELSMRTNCSYEAVGAKKSRLLDMLYNYFVIKFSKEDKTFKDKEPGEKASTVYNHYFE